MNLNKFLRCDLKYYLGYKLDTDTKKEIRNGAYAVLESDQGKLFRSLKRNEKYKAYGRVMSDHVSDSDVQQYRIDMKNGEGCILFSTIHGNTWFQVERNSPKKGCLAHFCNWIIHRLTCMNIGIDGMSTFTESQPLILKVNRTKK